MRLIIPVIGFLLTTSLHAQIRFAERAENLGVAHENIVWTVGTGVSLYDFNRDGSDDLTLGTEEGRNLVFYMNTGNGFQFIPPLIDHQANAKQILWADYDNDGDPDLFVVSFDDVSRLYRNDGDLSFTDVTSSAGLLEEVRRGYGAAWADINRDGWLDLYVNARDLPGSQDFQNINRLYISQADGTFIESAAAYGAADPDKIPFSSSFLDYNNDGWPDIYTANDRFTGNTLLENKLGKSFSDVSQVTGTGLAMNAMCVNFADLNHDGWLDIYVTNTAEGNKMLLNDPVDKSGDETQFIEVADQLGISFNGIGWGSNFLDADNDGDLDLYVSGQEEGTDDPSSLFYENRADQYFDIVRSGDFVKDTVPSFANAVGDWNNDGRPDILVQNNPPYAFHLWENQSNSGRWIKFELEGILSNREGVGSVIEIFYPEGYHKAYTHIGFGFLGQNSRQVHFGTNQIEVIDSARITWPSGHIDRYYDLATNRLYPFKEGGSTGGEITVGEDVVIVNRSVSTPTADPFDDPSLLVYPNPASDRIIIQTDSGLRSVHIYDAAGRLVYTHGRISENSLYIDGSTLPSGVYTLYINTGQGFQIRTLIKS